MSILKSLANSFVFWSAWIIIPLIMEVIPAIGSFIILIRRRMTARSPKKPIIYPEISIIVPVYNSEDTLEECIRSIHESDYPSKQIRVLLVNNKGTDSSFTVYTECQKKFGGLHMQWLNSEQGKSRALNLAIYNSDGKYIVHIDSDGVLEPSALTRMIDRFEDNPEINCMTGAIMTRPDMIEKYPRGISRLFRKLEFMEYAQAFLAGRNYASDINAIYTISGAFSAFRKSAILKSRLYNTDTLAEDTQITFQLRYLQKDRVYISENSIFFVAPIESIDKLYTQRQRWQRGSLEVSKMFIGGNMKAWQLFTDINVKTLMYDHTFALPRMIWYLAIICLMLIGYSVKTVLLAAIILFGIYTICGYFYYVSTCGFLSGFKDLRKYYARQWWIVPFLPFFNLLVFFIRIAGIINSINTASSWKTKTLSEEGQSFISVIKKDFERNKKVFERVRRAVNTDPSQMCGEKSLDKRLKGSWAAYTAVVLTAIISVILIVACYWSKKTFNVSFNAVIRTLAVGFAGAGGDTVGSALKFCLPFVAVFAVIVTAIVILERRASKKAASAADDAKIVKSDRIFAFRRFSAFLSICMLVGTVIYCDYCYDIKGYIAAKFADSSIYEQYYIDPKTVEISAEGKTRNLIYIYLESMESTYASVEEGGFQKVNYIPNLTRLANDNISFSTKPGFGGHYACYGSTWTMGALFATTSGLPYCPPVFGNADGESSEKCVFSGVTSLGDILYEHGYVNEFMCGSDSSYAGRADYFTRHGSYKIFDLFTAREKGYIPPDYFVWWGYEDEYLYKAAKDEVTNLYNSGKPFNLTLLTVDTHFVDGYICNLCGDDYPEKAANVVKCADKQLYDFVEWCRRQPFFEDTVIVITGDHPRMDTSLVDGISWQDRTVYNCYINATVETDTYSLMRDSTSLDVLPTVLSAMGFEIEGNRLGLGTNLFSNEVTLAEQIGFDALDYQLSLSSDYYAETFAPESAAESKVYPNGEINREQN